MALIAHQMCFASNFESLYFGDSLLDRSITQESHSIPNIPHTYLYPMLYIGGSTGCVSKDLSVSTMCKFVLNARAYVCVSARMCARECVWVCACVRGCVVNCLLQTG